SSTAEAAVVALRRPRRPSLHDQGERTHISIMTTPVRFRYFTGLDRPLWRNPRLTGSWDGWTSATAMDIHTTADDGVVFETTLELEPDSEYHWGVRVDTPTANNVWAIMDEIADLQSSDRHRTFRLGHTAHEERYFFTHLRRLGANGCFAVWAPNATNVEVVFGNAAHGYIADDGSGIDPAMPVLAMERDREGVWESERVEVPIGTPYMFRVTRANGDVRYRTDIYSRMQIGRGDFDPKGAAYTGDVASLDGTKSCSVVIDPHPPAGFWNDELRDRPLPQRIEDLVIYELHVGALAHGEPRPGTLEDAMDPRFLDHLEDLGVNAVELLPMMEFAGKAQWGYGTSHFFALESSAGGRDALRRFVKACHQRGIAVLLDVVYNHYHHDAERAQWAYDSDVHDDNIYYWREEGHYVDNESTGYAPRYWQEFVRKMFISSAVMLVEELHIDGLRVDQTTSIRSYNKLAKPFGRGVPEANVFGAKFLRQLARTVKLVKPQALLIAEDHSEGEEEKVMTRSTREGGLGFDASWFSAFYHNLIGDAHGRSEARLLREAGMGGDWPLRMDHFAGALAWTAQKKVVYGESHDEAGNARESARTIVVAGGPRSVAEARCRFAFAMAAFSAGTPMFLSGEEIGAAKEVRYDNPLEAKEDLFGERLGNGAKLFAYYSDVIKLRLRRPALRARSIEVRHVNNEARTIAFTRTDGIEQLLIAGTLSNATHLDFGIAMEGRWQEIFNSDSAFYGGTNTGNFGATLEGLRLTIPANGVVMFKRVG
ncbi:MAG TPA: alpha-amylase family glycosyl hydrolase, partial [Thermoanaerobaculia bacterium]|nr:alpha-amylase family glycosyl hydrolase [Thermoanaerobaculia bacterium]